MLDGKAELAAYGVKFDQAHVAEFWFAEAEIAKSEDRAAIGIELGEKPWALGVGGEKFYEGFEIECR